MSDISLGTILLAWYVISSLLWQWTQSINPLIKKLQSSDRQKELSDTRQRTNVLWGLVSLPLQLPVEETETLESLPGLYFYLFHTSKSALQKLKNILKNTIYS